MTAERLPGVCLAAEHEGPQISDSCERHVKQKGYVAALQSVFRPYIASGSFDVSLAYSGRGKVISICPQRHDGREISDRLEAAAMKAARIEAPRESCIRNKQFVLQFGR